MYIEKKEQGCKENHGIQNTGTEDSKGNLIIDKRHILKILDNYITEFYNGPNRLENLEDIPEEEVDADEKAPYILQSEMEKLSRR